MYALRSVIRDSWQRCHVMQVNPSRRCAPLAIARETQLYHLREVNELLIRATRSAMSHLTDFLADSGYVIVLSDAKGCLLDVVGDVGIRRRLARIDFVPGGDWSEAAAGTNAIGTALADGHVVQLMAAEHYCDGWQDLTCTAAPVRHPFTGEIVGILDVTGDYHLIRPFLTNSLAAAALEVQHELCTLLTTPKQQKCQAITVSFPVGGRATTRVAPTYREIDMNNNTHRQDANEDLLTSPTVDDMRLQLNLEQRRTHDAERLALAWIWTLLLTKWLSKQLTCYFLKVLPFSYSMRRGHPFIPGPGQIKRPLYTILKHYLSSPKRSHLSVNVANR